MFGRPVEPPTVTLDQESFRALASEVRVEILKRLDKHRMTVTDLSNALTLSKPTLLEHLERLQTAALVKRVDEGRKWIYYELTGKAKKILHPERVQIIVALATSAILLSVGAFALVAGLRSALVAPASSGGGLASQRDSFGTLGGLVSGPSDAMLLGVVLLVLAAIPLLTAFALFRLGRRRHARPVSLPE